ncbi:hypothetical protein HDU98_003148 [Podochytrium sp. JEL0797]|nr:hypothetical protein HDU98_003148 [Podochytrium sp. JEL0797]
MYQIFIREINKHNMSDPSTPANGYTNSASIMFYVVGVLVIAAFVAYCIKLRRKDARIAELRARAPEYKDDEPLPEYLV